LFADLANQIDVVAVNGIQINLCLKIAARFIQRAATQIHLGLKFGKALIARRLTQLDQGDLFGEIGLSLFQLIICIDKNAVASRKNDV